MNFRTLIAVAITSFGLISVAQAQTTTSITSNDFWAGQQFYQDNLGGYSNKGQADNNTFVRKEATTITTPNPDIVTSTEVLVSPAVENTPRDYSGLATWCPMIRTMNGGETYPSNVNADCTPMALNSGSGGFPAVYRTDTTVTSGGVTVSPGCTTYTKTTDLDTSAAPTYPWSVTDYGGSTSGGSC